MQQRAVLVVVVTFLLHIHGDVNVGAVRRRDGHVHLCLPPRFVCAEEFGGDDRLVQELLVAHLVQKKLG
jgi:hypothetical protein